MILYFNGYHGTDAESGQGIINSRKFRPSLDDECWLGEGVYFFESDVEQAHHWCTKKKRFPSWKILKSDLQCDDSMIWDLNRIDHYREFQRIADTIKNKYQKNDKHEPRQHIDGVVMNIIYEFEKFHMARGTFDAPAEFYPRGYVAGRIRFRPRQTILCVRNHDCIRTIEEVMSDEHQTA